MSETTDGEYWTAEEIERRLQAVREALLEFLHERTRLDWFRHKVRWRLSRQYIWPAASDSRQVMLDAAVEDDVSVEAFRDYLSKRQHTISDAIERYNHALRRNTEAQRGQPLADFDEPAREELRRQRITFQGVRDELRRRARQVTVESGPELLPELLSLRLAILIEEVRDEIFSEVAATVADEEADARGDMAPIERDLIALQTELRLRCLDRYHVARLLAENYTEGRRFMKLDTLLAQYKALAGELREAASPEPIIEAKLELYREVLQKSLAFLEEIFPSSAGTHDRLMSLLRQAPVE